MPLYEIQGPDGKIYEIEGPEGATREQVITAIQAKLRQQPKQAGFVESFKQSATTLKAAPAAARFVAAQTPEEQRAAREELLQITGGDEQLLTTSFADVLGGQGSALDWAKQVAGGSAGFLAAPFAAGAAGLAAGPIGGAVGMYGTLAGQYTTSNIIRQAEEQARAEAEGRTPEETSLGKAVVAAGGQTLADRLGFSFFKPILGKFPLVGKIFSEGDQGAKEVTDRIIEAHKNGSLTFKGGIAKGVAGGVAVEVPQEIAQTALERWQASLPLFNEEARGEYLEAAAGGALLGAGLGGARGASQISSDRRRAEDILETLREKETAEKKEEAPAADVTPPAPAAPKEDKYAKALAAINSIPEESQISQYLNMLVDQGFTKKDAQSILRDFKKDKVLVKGEKEGRYKLSPIQEDVAAFEPTEGVADLVEVGETVPAAGQDIRIPSVAQETAAPTVTPEVTPSEPTKISTEPVVAGAVAGSAGVPVPQLGAAERGTEVPQLAGLGGVDVGAGRVDEGKKPVPVTLAPEKWRERVEKQKGDDPTSTKSILGRLNSLKSELAKYEPLPILERNSKIEEAVSLLRESGGLDIQTLGSRLNISRSATAEILTDLREEGIVNEDNTLNDTAFSETDQQNLTAYDRYLAREETPLQESARLIDRLLDKESETKIRNSTSLRAGVNERVVELEDYLTKLKENEAIREGIEAELPAREAQAYARAQEEIATDIGQDVMQYNRPALEEAVASKNINNVLDYISNRAAQNQLQTLDEDVVEQQAQQRSEDVRAKPAEIEGMTPEEAARRQRYTDIETEQNRRDTLENVRAELSKGFATIGDSRLRSEQQNRFTEELANRLRAIDFSNMGVQVEGESGADQKVFSRLKSEGKVAEYDPKTNTVYLTRKGVSPKVILHEVIHAATVRVLRQYEVDPAKLTRDQRDAAEHINKIYEYAKSRLGGRYKNAFENVYEFVSYAMTEPKFQQELARFRRPSLAKYTKQVEDLWEQFTDALKQMFGLMKADDLAKKYKAKAKGGKLRQATDVLEARRLDPEGNLLLELSEAFNEVVAPPKKGVDVAPLAAKGKTLRAPQRTAEQIKEDNRKKIRTRYPKTGLVKSLKELTFGYDGYENLVKKFQNDRRPLLTLENQLRLAGKLQVLGDKANNLFSLLTLSSGKAFHAMSQYLQRHMDDTHRAINDYAKARGISMEDALGDLDAYFMARHEPERRHIKFLLNVPLNNKTSVQSALIRKVGTPANLRAFAVRELYNNFADTRRRLGRDLTQQERNQLAKDYRKGLEQLVAAYKDKDGSSPMKAKPGSLPIDETAEQYNVIGTQSRDTINELQAEFNAQLQDGEPTAAPLRKLIASLDKVKSNAQYLDKQANYWSPQVNNIVEFYDYKNYMPFKGKYKDESMVSESDGELELGGTSYDTSLTEFAVGTKGRETDSDNVVLQVLVDGARSSMRAGRIGISQAIKNLVNDKYIRGKLIKTVRFEDRFTGISPSEIRGMNRIFHYTPEGDIEIYEIRDSNIREAIRRTYNDTNPYLELANRATSFVGHTHTRYNPAFYPYNFVRDALTHAFSMGAEIGPRQAYEYIGAVAAQIGKMGMIKTGNIAKLYAENKISEIEALAKKDPNVQLMYEFLQEGGRVSYIQGLALKGQMDELLSSIGKQKFATTKDQVNKWFDIWADSFELTSRAAAYGVMKSEALARGLSEAAARQEAAAYSKNLANFEQVGKYGKQAGSLFMFFRPAATGAVRALDSIGPLFQDVDALVRRLPPAVQADPEAVATFKKNFADQRKRATSMLYGLIGAGATLYLMAYMASDDDELGRNKVETDDMSLWTRNLRLPLGFMGGEGFLQVPWGFGLGAFGAAGAQIAGAAFGKTSIIDMAVNMGHAGMDSFVPLPISQIDPTENFSAFLIDSITPSLARPFVQFVMNVDGLGREVYNNRQTRYGEAFTGGKNVPQMFKDASAYLLDATNSEVSVQPNTMYFWTNSYLDGFTRIANAAYGLNLYAGGSKDFDPKADLAVLSSFIGRKGNYDGREFASVERQILAKREKYNALVNRAELTGDIGPLQNYLEKNPNDPIIVYVYNQQINNTLRELRSYKNSIQSDTRRTPKEKREIIDMIDLNQNYIKRGLIETFKQYGIKPN